MLIEDTLARQLQGMKRKEVRELSASSSLPGDCRGERVKQQGGGGCKAVLRKTHFLNQSVLLVVRTFQ